ncbi:MAG TPA: hypothetical protein VFR81_15020 [Longimicrobium sp.]|nr:hypothetical protein [Longimicrobium sp.]
MKRLRPASGQVARALLLLVAAWAAGRLLRPATEIQRLPGHPPAASAAAYDSSLAYVRGTLSDAATRLLAPYPAGADGRVVALLRAADWQSCEDLGRQLRELRRYLASDSILVVWTEPADVLLMERRLKRERIAAAVSAGPALDSVFSNARRLPTPAVIVVSRDGAHADGIAHTRRMPNVRTRSFREELPLIPRFHRPAGKLRPGTGSSSTSESEPSS